MTKTTDTSPQTLRILQDNIRQLRDAESRHDRLHANVFEELKKFRGNMQRTNATVSDLTKLTTGACDKLEKTQRYWESEHLKLKKSHDKENNRIWIVFVLIALFVLANSYFVLDLLYTK